MTVGKRFLLIAVALLFSWSAVAAPKFAKGDSFTYRVRGKNFTHVYQGLDQNGNHVFDYGRGPIVFTPFMSMIEKPGTKVIPHNGQLLLDPDVGFRVGIKWEMAYRVIKSDGRKSDKVRVCAVVAYDAARQVVAGTFDAYRVDCDIKQRSGGTRYSAAWYDSQTWRVLEFRVGNSKGNLRKVMELVDLSLSDR